MASLQKHIADKLREFRTEGKYSVDVVGEVVGKSGKTISAWEVYNGQPKADDIVSLAKFFGKSASDFYAGYEGFDEYSEVPLLGRIAAGQPIEMDEVENSWSIPQTMKDRYPNAFLLIVDGESMNRILPNGSYALINPVDEIRKDNAPYAVCVNGYDATIKRVHRLNNGFELVPDSTDPTFTPQIFNYNEPGTDIITCIGEVVWYTLPYDWSF